MPMSCDVIGCVNPAGLMIRGYGLCAAHGDEVIDRLREAGLNPRTVPSDKVTEILGRWSNGQDSTRRIR